MKNSTTSYNLLKSLTPNGSQTLSKMPDRFVNGVYPKVLSRGTGGVVYDVDGNSYIDLISGLGAISVGYANPYINSVIEAQLRQGVIFSLPNMLEYHVARRLNELVGFTEQWKFLKTGTEGTTAAVKAARAFTGRMKVLTCGYHGWNDWYATQNDRKAGIPAFNDLLVDKAKYNDLFSFHRILDGEYAAIIMEPMVFDFPVEGFLETIRDWCSTSGTLLIFDEVVTGGRTSGFVAANKFRVEPDLIVLSKSLANGLPLAGVGGKKYVMQTFECSDFFVSGTFGGECISLAACLATLELLQTSIGRMILKGLRIREEFNKLFFHTQAKCKGYPTRLTFDFPTPEHKALFMQEMCLNGVLTGYSNMVMADYTEENVETILKAIRITNSVMIDNWSNPKAVLRGDMPVETLRLR